MAGIDSSKISPSNPFEKSGSTAGMLQAAIAELDPAQAARWRVAAGGSLSVSTLSELQGGEELSAAAQADLWNHDPEFVAEFQQQREKGLEAQLKALEDGANQKRFQNAVVRAGGLLGAASFFAVDGLMPSKVEAQCSFSDETVSVW